MSIHTKPKAVSDRSSSFSDHDFSDMTRSNYRPYQTSCQSMRKKSSLIAQRWFDPFKSNSRDSRAVDALNIPSFFISKRHKKNTDIMNGLTPDKIQHKAV